MTDSTKTEVLDSEQEDRVITHKEHKRLEIYIRWILGMLSVVIIASFGWVFDTNGRLTVLETSTLSNARYIDETSQHNYQSVDRRITSLERRVDEFAPAVSEIRTDIKYISQAIKRIESQNFNWTPKGGQG
jgi:hypothetical protein